MRTNNSTRSKQSFGARLLTALFIATAALMSGCASTSTRPLPVVMCPEPKVSPLVVVSCPEALPLLTDDSMGSLASTLLDVSAIYHTCRRAQLAE